MISVKIYFEIIGIEQLHVMSFCLEAVVLPGGKAMEHLYGNGRKFASFSLTSPALVIEHLQYKLPVSVTSNYGSTL